MPRFTVNCSWKMFGFYEIEAENEEEALSIVQDADFPNNASFDGETFTVESVEKEV